MALTGHGGRSRGGRRVVRALAEPDEEHAEPEQRHDRQEGDRDPREGVLVRRDVDDPQHEADGRQREMAEDARRPDPIAGSAVLPHSAVLEPKPQHREAAAGGQHPRPERDPFHGVSLLEVDGVSSEMSRSSAAITRTPGTNTTLPPNHPPTVSAANPSTLKIRPPSVTSPRS